MATTSYFRKLFKEKLRHLVQNIFGMGFVLYKRHLMRSTKKVQASIGRTPDHRRQMETNMVGGK